MSGSLGVVPEGRLATLIGGRDKGALPLVSSTFLTHVIDRLTLQANGIALNANSDGLRFDHLEFPVIADSIDGVAGSLAGVLAGLDWTAEQGVTRIMTVAADAPFFSFDLATRLDLEDEGMTQPLVIAATPDPIRGTSRPPTFGLWPDSLREYLRAALLGGVRKVVQWTDSHDVRLAMFPIDQVDPFFNVKIPEDFAQAKAMI